MPRSICESAFQLASLAEPVATMRTPLRNEPFFAELTEQIEERYVAWYLSNRNSRSLDMSVSPLWPAQDRRPCATATPNPLACSHRARRRCFARSPRHSSWAAWQRYRSEYATSGNRRYEAIQAPITFATIWWISGAGNLTPLPTKASASLAAPRSSL